MSNQLFTSIAAALLLAAAPLALGQEVAASTAADGFYGGVSQRAGGSEGPGLSFGHLVSSWSKFALPVANDSGTRTLAYGGFRWKNHLALEAAVATADRFVLNPLTASRSAVGLSLASGGDPSTRAWNADVYTTWEFRRSFALYGRLGYLLSDPNPAYLAGSAADTRRNRDGVNYGVGLRYDMTRALGLRLEYSRFGHVSGEAINGVLPESDQLQFGVQFRF